MYAYVFSERVERRPESDQMRSAFMRVDVVHIGEDVLAVLVVVLEGRLHLDRPAVLVLVRSPARRTACVISAGRVASMYFTNSTSPPLKWNVSSCSVLLRRSMMRSVTSELRNASSRNRSATVSNLNIRFLKICPSGMNVIRVPVLPVSAFAGHLRGRNGFTARVLLEPDLSVTVDLRLQPLAQRVDHRNADAVQTARDFVGVLVELAAGVQHGHDDFQCRPLLLLVHVGRNAAAVVRHRHRTVFVER